MAKEAKKSWDPSNFSPEEITPEEIFLNRRAFLKASAVAGVGIAFPHAVYAAKAVVAPRKAEKYELKGEAITPESLATTYNNFYEFSLEKEAVAKKVEAWKLDPASWKIEVAGLVEKPKIYTMDELLKLAGVPTEERVYRFRCVEAWSMVVPWQGIPLAALIDKLKPGAKAKFVKFQTFSDRKIGTNMNSLAGYPWPYTEGLTLEEARHPLALLATGMYGKPLPKQNGAPLRLVVPWKYGFKSIKSIVKIEFTETQPKSLWMDLAPSEYGFYANVNPKVDHPRWSQATERVLDKSFFPKRKPTLMFNGYEEEVASLYKGLDLAKNY
jgi:sulfoxide reductase catalytic subunit YedY